jgi:hypothetical protein
LFGGLLAVGCGKSSDSNDSIRAAIRSQLTRVSALSFNATASIPSNPAPDVQVTVSDPAAADVASAILDLPAIPPGEYNCPIDFGISYFLVFTGGDPSGGGETVMTATLDPGGCEPGQISADGQHVDHFGVTTGANFWSRLAGDLGVPEADIFPYQPPPAQ